MTRADEYRYKRQPNAPLQKPHKPGDALPATAGWLTLALGIAAAVGFLFGPLIPPSAALPISIAVSVLLLASVVLRKIPGFSYILLAVVPSAIGLMLYPIIASYVAAGMTGAVVLSFVGTVVIFAVTAVIAWFTKKTIYRVTGVLFGITLALLAVSLLNALLFQIPVLGLLISFGVIILFTIWTFVDIQRVRDGLGKPVDMALNVFIDVVNIFLSLLNITSWFSD